jgi:hypothetical protein
MKQIKAARAATLGLVGVLGIGAATALGGPYMSQVWRKPAPDGISWGAHTMPEVPTLVGPWGQPVPVAAPYNVKPPTGEDAARAMLSQSMPLELLQQTGYADGMPIPPILQAGGPCAGGACPAPGYAGGYPPGMMPPAGMISPPGVPGLPPPPLPPPPGGGPTPPPGFAPHFGPPGAVAAVGALSGHAPSPFPVMRTEVRFVGPPGMKISWYAPAVDGKPGFSAQYLEAPARYNFLQASFYRLKLSDIPNRPGVELYPTLEVVPAKAKTCTFLAHSAVPVLFTEDDFEQVAAGNFVVKVIYLPDPMFQDLAATGPDEVVSSRLPPGLDPICEAQKRGCILLVVRLGNIDLEAPNTPPMDAPNPFQLHAAAPPPQMGPGMPGMGPMVLPPGPLAGRPPMMPPQMPPPPGMQLPPAAMGGQPGQMPMPPQGQITIPPPGQMLPAVPTGRPMMPPNGMQMPGGPGGPLSQLPDPSTIQQASNKPSTPNRRPTLAELAGQLMRSKAAKTDGNSQP